MQLLDRSGGCTCTAKSEHRNKLEVALRSPLADGVKLSRRNINTYAQHLLLAQDDHILLIGSSAMVFCRNRVRNNIFLQSALLKRLPQHRVNVQVIFATKLGHLANLIQKDDRQAGCDLRAVGQQ